MNKIIAFIYLFLYKQFKYYFENKKNILRVRFLKELYNGPSEEFDNFLKENYFDLHYQTHANVEPVNLGLGHLWRLAVDHPKQKVLPCIHRAPIEREGEYRLLLIC